MWYHTSVFYQIYPFGFCGAPAKNDGVVVNRIDKIRSWIPHMKQLGVNALYLCPVFESDSHGYDTRDYTKLDGRLGTNENFSQICGELHDANIRIVLDGVFNHVGRGFWAFQDVQKNKQNSAYKDWFHLDFHRDSNSGDGFWYEGWEGHFELVKLNLDNPQVVDYLLQCLQGWMDEFDIDGLRLDVAYLLPKHFLRRLREFCSAQKPDFFLLGEVIHGDYTQYCNPEMLDSCTNYECYKGIHSSLNSRNLFEIGHSLSRQFGPEEWTLYKDLYLFNFVDNHDVSRIASQLSDPHHLTAAYGLLFGMPGIPCIYYGSEWGTLGDKAQGDQALRPAFSLPQDNALTRWLAFLTQTRRTTPALTHGDYQQVYLNNLQLVFSRKKGDSNVLVAINAADKSCKIPVPIEGNLLDMQTGSVVVCDGELELAPSTATFYTAT